MIQTLLLIVLGFFIFVSPVFAVSVTISNTPSTITDQPFTFNVSVTGAQSGTNYLRANFFPSGTTKYFGYTFNGSTFVNSSDYSQYLPINIDSSGNWSGDIQAKLDTSSSYYSGPGTYSFKVRRYTSSGSSYTWSNEVTLVVNVSSSDPTPTPSPTSVPSTTPSSTSTSSNPTQFSISNTPSQITSDEVFTVLVNLSLPNSPNTSFYLKGAFKKADGSNYFGLTKVSGSWVKNGSSYSSQFPITTDSSGNWTGNLDIQPDSEDSGFSGSGDYLFKVGRYAQAGSGPTWSNEVTIKIISVGTNSEGGSTTTNTSSSTTKSSPSPSSQISKTSSQAKSYATPAVHSSAVAGESTSSTPSATPSNSPSTSVKQQKFFNLNIWTILGSVFILAGLGSIGYVYLRKKKNDKNHHSF